MSKIRLTIGILLALGLAGLNAWQYWLKPAPDAPALTMSTLTGEQLSLQALQGKPVLISFWATGCGLCLSEIDDLIAMHNDYQAQGYTTLAVALAYDSLPAVKAMKRNKPLPYKVIYDRQGTYAKAFGGVRMTPTHFLISPEGKVIWQNVGPIKRPELEALVKPFLPAA